LQTGKNIPLAWNHSIAAEDIIGHIDPASVRVLDDWKVAATGWIDESVDPAGKHAWRLVKSGTLGFSYGYLIPDGGATKRAGSKSGLHIKELDVFEITATPIPANNATGVLSWKSVQDRDAVIVELQEVKARLDTLEKALEDQKTTVDVTGKAPRARSVDPLRTRAMDVAMEIMSDGLPAQPPTKQATKEPETSGDPDELRERSRDLMLQVLTGTQ
jgi:hypothetical protein